MHRWILMTPFRVFPERLRPLPPLRTQCKCFDEKSWATYHGQRSLGLLQQRLWQQGDVDALGDGHCAAIQVGNNYVQL